MVLGRALTRFVVSAALLGGAATAVHADWPMLAANPQRTSWVADEIRGNVQAVWYRPIEPYINYKIQIIAAQGKVFVSTARGLYALHADTGAVLWVYPTDVPLGHSPTYSGGKLYVGSYDRTIHCIDAATGTKVAGWNPYVALAGFETNPLVVGGRVYAGNRDGYFYSLDANTGALVWRFKTGAAIRNSAAMDAQNVLYFASEDLRAYALRDLGATYELVWKSQKLLGDTFATYWPVVYRNWVVFSAGMGYFNVPPWGGGVQLPWDEKDDINADLTQVTGTVAGDWAPGTVTMDASPILQYYESKPHRRRVFMLNRANGQEYTFDTDGDGKAEYAPFTFSGVKNGAKYPPVVGSDGVIYTHVDTYAPASAWTPSGALVGWNVGTEHLSRVMDWGVKQQQASDEPMAFSVGGKLAYWTLCCDRESGSFDLTIPFGQPNRWWYFWGYNERFAKFPGYEPMYYGDDADGWGVYGGSRGVYGKHGAQNPWVPYAGKLYRQMGNAVIAVAPNGSAAGPLPLAKTVATTAASPLPALSALKGRLEEEVAKIIAAGHLKPGLFRSNNGDFALNGNGESGMDQGLYYFSSPGDTVYALLRALPHLSPTLQTQTRTYVQNEVANYPFDTYAYVGHLDGAPRQAAVVPPEHQGYFAIAKQTSVYNDLPWNFPMTAFYAAWKYAQVWPAEASKLYSKMKPKVTVPCKLSDSELLSETQMLNAYLAGYRGYLELEKLAAQPESASVKAEYDRLLTILVSSFSIDAPWIGWYTDGGFDLRRNFVYARHFLYLVPEVAEELRKTKLAEVQKAVDRINAVTPYWFVAGYDATHGEGTHQQLYDVATFDAYAMVLKTPYPQILRYLDAPAFPVGDLLYIHHLASVLDAAAGTPEPPGPPPVLAPLGTALTVGGTNTLTGSGFTAGSVVKLFVATATGAQPFGPYAPTNQTGTSLTWGIPATVPLGNGYGSVQVVNTDAGYVESNVVGALLEGDPADNLPTLLYVNGVGLAAADPAIGVAHVDTVVGKGTVVTLVGTGFNGPAVNLYTAAGNVGPLWPMAGGSATQVQVQVPGTAPAGPGTFQVVNAPQTGNVASNAVAVVIGAPVSIATVGVSGTTVMVTGTGFSALSVVNLFNKQGSVVVNLGGLNGATPKIPLSVVNDTLFTFTVPAGAVAGPAFLEVLNPPYIPFSSSGADPDGAFTLP